MSHGTLTLHLPNPSHFESRGFVHLHEPSEEWLRSGEKDLTGRYVHVEKYAGTDLEHRDFQEQLFQEASILAVEEEK